MTKRRKKLLEKNGWKFGNAKDFIKLLTKKSK